MKKYTFIIDRIAYTSAEVSVMAEDKKTAHKEASRLSRDVDFSGKETTYEYETTIIDEEPT